VLFGQKKPKLQESLSARRMGIDPFSAKHPVVELFSVRYDPADSAVEKFV
jgi:hypothetical protein